LISVLRHHTQVSGLNARRHTNLRMMAVSRRLRPLAVNDHREGWQMYMTMARELAERETATAANLMPSAEDEVNHRVANQLQLIAALISAEERSISDPMTLDVLERTRQRIVAVGAVHRQLYAGGHSEAELGKYLEDLGEQLARSCGPHRRIVVNAEAIPVNAEIATAFGILVTELVTNACKHAYAAGEPGEVHIGFRRRAPGAYQLTVEDSGVGPGSGARGAGLGSRLINATVAKLSATAKWEDSQPGTRFRMEVRF
jgi:two-component sensor histidine kinase